MPKAMRSLQAASTPKPREGRDSNYMDASGLQGLYPHDESLTDVFAAVLPLPRDTLTRLNRTQDKGNYQIDNGGRHIRERGPVTES